MGCNNSKERAPQDTRELPPLKTGSFHDRQTAFVVEDAKAAMNTPNAGESLPLFKEAPIKSLEQALRADPELDAGRSQALAVAATKLMRERYRKCIPAHLTVDEAAAVALYTSDAIVHATIGKRLHAKDPSELTAALPFLRLLTKGLSRLPRADHFTTVYRWVRYDLRSFLDVGSTFSLSGIPSVTRSRDEATAALGPNDTLLSIEALDIVNTMMFTKRREHEWLMFPRTKLRVEKVEQLESGAWEVKLRQVPQTDKPYPDMFQPHIAWERSESEQTSAGSEDALTWVERGELISAGGSISKEEDPDAGNYSREFCYIKALERDDNCTRAWIGLAVALCVDEHRDESSLADGRIVTLRECVVRAVECSPYFASLWVFMGYITQEQGGDSPEPTTIRGKTYTFPQEFFLHSLSLDTENSRAWSALAVTMGTEDVVEVNGKPMSRADCLHSSIEAHRYNADSWAQLGFLLFGTKEKVEVRGSYVDSQGCFLEVLELDPTNSVAWRNLGLTLADDESVAVGGKLRKAKTCFIEAVLHDAEHEAAWANLGAAMLPGETLKMNGNTFQKDDCLAMAAQLTGSGSPASPHEPSDLNCSRGPRSK